MCPTSGGVALISVSVLYDIVQKKIICPYSDLHIDPKNLFPSGFDEELRCCPDCGERMIRHGYYWRLLDWYDPHVRIFYDEKVRIPRLRCKSCRKTHAVLPDFIAPWFIFSRPLIVLLLLAFAKGLPDQYNTDFDRLPLVLHQADASLPRTIFRWIRRIREEAAELGLARPMFRSLVAFFNRMGQQPLPQPPVRFLLSPALAAVSGDPGLSFYRSCFSCPTANG